MFKSCESMGRRINNKMIRPLKSPKEQAQGPTEFFLGGRGDFQVF